MSVGKFHQVDLPPGTGRVTVTGPFDPQDDSVNFAKILFLVVQGDRGGDVAVIPGEGSWSRGSGDWTGTMQRTGVPDLGGTDRELRAGEIARGIAVSIVVKPGKMETDDFDPPSIEALTWCANFMIGPSGSGGSY